MAASEQQLSAKQIHDRTVELEARLQRLKERQIELNLRATQMANNFKKGIVVARPQIDGVQVAQTTAQHAMKTLRKRQAANSETVYAVLTELSTLNRHPNNTQNTHRLLNGPRGAEARDAQRAESRNHAHRGKKRRQERRRSKESEKVETMASAYKAEVAVMQHTRSPLMAATTAYPNFAGVTLTSEAEVARLIFLVDRREAELAQQRRAEEIAAAWSQERSSSTDRRDRTLPTQNGDAERRADSLPAASSWEDGDFNFKDRAKFLSRHKKVPRAAPRLARS